MSAEVLTKSEGGGVDDQVTRTPLRELIAQALGELGPATAKEVADHIGRQPEDINSALRAMAERGLAQTTGQAPYEAGRRGPPPKLWSLVHVNGGGSAVATASPPSAPAVDDRVQALAKQVAAANTRIEDLQGVEEELLAARRRIEQLEADLAENEADRQSTERRAQLAEDELDAVRRQLAQREEAGVIIQPSDSDDELTVLAELVHLPAGAPAHIVAARLRAAFEWFEELGYSIESGQIVRRADNAEQREMRRSYFDALLKMAASDGAEEHLFDRLERLVAAGGLE